MFFEHVNFQPRASRAQHFYFLQNGPCRYKFVTVPLPKRLRNGRFNSETATRQTGPWREGGAGAVT